MIESSLLGSVGLALAEAKLIWPLLASALAFLVPIGLALIASGGSPEERAVSTALLAPAAIGLAALGYFACGFALQFGGVGLAYDLPGLRELVWEWSPVDVAWGRGWGALGLKGFFLEGADSPLARALFFSQLPLVTTAVLIPLLTLRAKPFARVLAALLVSAVIYPVAGNWAWGGGWLANLGRNLGLGHGFVDFAGAGLVNLLGGAVALAGILAFGLRRRRQAGPARMPPVHLPLLTVLGSLLLVVGWLGLALGNPLHALQEGLPLTLIALNLVLAAGGGGLPAMLYSWFVSGRADALMAARGVAAGLVAVSAACPFIPPWAALAVGAFAGLLLPLSIYFVERVLWLDDPAAALSVHGLGGLLGLLAVGIFADGRYGAGWNGVGVGEYLGVAGQGVSGYFVAQGFIPDWPIQLRAQLLGLAAIFVFAFVLAWPIFKLMDLLARAGGSRSTDA